VRPRGIDHLVIAVRDLDKARATWQRLGFTLTPEGVHPFGTKNSLVQLEGGFLELVAINDPATIPPATDRFFSFSSFVRDFIARQDGMAMAALKSDDPNIDFADFASRGLPAYEPVKFQRVARGPDGSERQVAFAMTFTADKRLPEAGFFTCRHYFPENFWRDEYRKHENSARRIEAVTMVAGNPADFHEFLTYFTGVRDIQSTSLGIAFDTGDGRVEVMSPAGFQGLYGGAAGAVEADPRRFAACRIAVSDAAAAKAALGRNKVPFMEQQEGIVVSAEAANGVVVALVERKPGGSP